MKNFESVPSNLGFLAPTAATNWFCGKSTTVILRTNGKVLSEQLLNVIVMGIVTKWMAIKPNSFAGRLLYSPFEHLLPPDLLDVQTIILKYNVFISYLLWRALKTTMCGDFQIDNKT